MPDDRLPPDRGRLPTDAPKPDVQIQGTNYLQITISWKLGLTLVASIAGMIFLFSGHVDDRFAAIDMRLDALESSLQRILGAITGVPAD